MAREGADGTSACAQPAAAAAATNPAAQHARQGCASRWDWCGGRWDCRARWPGRRNRRDLPAGGAATPLPLESTGSCAPPDPRDDKLA
eukprot:2917469-Pyramimonas_sp.AAC.1